MSEYKCSVCPYVCYRKEHIIKHINRKIKCGEGTPVIIENKINVECTFCNKKFSTKSNLSYHVNNSCKAKMEILNKKIETLQKENELLKNDKNNKGIVINGNVIQNIIVLNGYNDTNVSKLNDKYFLKAIGKMCLSVPTMIRDVHFNPNMPENQNIYISNMRNGYVMVFNSETKNWDARPKEEMIDKLINDREYDIQEWLGEGEKYPKAMQKFNEYIEKKEEDGVQKMIKDEVELVLYNNRNMIKNKSLKIKN